MQKKRRILAIALIPLAIAGISVALYFIFFQKTTAKKNFKQYDVNPKLVDSLLSTMSLEQKVAQIIINDTINDTLNPNFGFFTSCDAFNKRQICRFESKNTAYLPNFICSFSDKFPDYKLPASCLLSVTDTGFLSQFLKFEHQKAINCGNNLIFVDLIENLSTFPANDSIYFRTLTNFVHQYSANYDRNIILSIPFLNLKDTLRAKYYNEIVKDISTNAFSYYATDSSVLFNKKFASFYGLIASKEDFLGNFENYFNSNCDLIITNDTGAYRRLLTLAKKNSSFVEKLNLKVKKILFAKVHIKNNTKDSDTILNFPSCEMQKYFALNFVKKSLVLINNKSQILPIVNINLPIKCFVFTKNGDFSTFESEFRKFDFFNFTFKQLDNFNLNKIVISKNELNIFIIDSLNIDSVTFSKFKSLDSANKILFVNINNIQNLKQLKQLNNLMFSWSNNKLFLHYLVNAISGGNSIDGKLPVFDNTSNLKINKIRLGYDFPEAVGLNSRILQQIDSIANISIEQGAFPGCEVFLAKNGQIIFQKSYGYIDYSHNQKVNNNTLYDIASVTKIAATTLATMKLFEQGKISLDDKLGKFFKNKKIDYSGRNTKKDTLSIVFDTINIYERKDWRTICKNRDTVRLNDTFIVTIDTLKYQLSSRNNIFNVSIRELLTHTSGIQPALSILKFIADTNKLMVNIFNDTSLFSKLSTSQRIQRFYSQRLLKDSAEVQVAQNMYLLNCQADSLWEDTKALRVSGKKIFVYSDVNMILLKKAIDSITHEPFDNFMNRTFYRPLGLKYITFQPLKKFDRRNIAPTENDRYWRKQLVWGYVHDPSAALLGGIAGNAGLFSNAFSLGVIGQMLLNQGTYGGVSFLNKQTVKLFTSVQPQTNRGLGFDLWSKNQIAAQLASKKTYGHTGFTGNCIWIDPDNQMVYVFLSNRVNPNVKNQLINKLKVRQKIHQVAYNSVFYFAI